MRNLFLMSTAIVVAAPMAALAAEHTVFFNHDSATLTPEGRAVVQQAAADYIARGETAISIVGHTDTTGTREYNLALSERRARTVVDTLTGLGVPAAAMTAAWRGQDDLAVQTGDNVREPRNRRVEIAISEPAAAPVAAAPVTPEQVVSALRVGVGPYVGFNMQQGDNSTFAGINLSAAYDINPNVAIVGEQAIFYNFGADDEGVGGRTAVGAELSAGDFGGVTPYIGGHGGALYVDGSGKDGWFIGPRVGVRAGNFEVRASYDFFDNRGWEDGVASVTAGANFRF
jgi:hypothetical protein